MEEHSPHHLPLAPFAREEDRQSQLLEGLQGQAREPGPGRTNSAAGVRQAELHRVSRDVRRELKRAATAHPLKISEPGRKVQKVQLAAQQNRRAQLQLNKIHQGHQCGAVVVHGQRNREAGGGSDQEADSSRKDQGSLRLAPSLKV